MSEIPEDGEQVTEDGTIVFLRRLVTVVTATMVLGMLAVAVVVALRVGKATPGPALPERIVLPDGAKARAVTAGDGWYLVVTDKDEVLVFDTATGKLRQRVPIE